MKYLLIALALGLGLFFAPMTAECDSCGIVPIKPIPPLGCRDMVASCVCDANGNNCHWQWSCVK